MALKLSRQLISLSRSTHVCLTPRSLALWSTRNFGRNFKADRPIHTLDRSEELREQALLDEQKEYE